MLTITDVSAPEPVRLAIAAAAERSAERARVKRREYREANRERIRAYDRAYKAAHRKPKRAPLTAEQKAVRQANLNLQYNYGITLEQKMAMLEAQGGVCKICREYRPGRLRGWHTDHDHATGRVRGILCASCNTTLGRVRDDVSILRRMIDYLGGGP